MYTLILTLIILGSQPDSPPTSSMVSVVGFASESNCKTAGQRWKAEKEVVPEDGNWKVKKSFVCSRATQN